MRAIMFILCMISTIGYGQDILPSKAKRSIPIPTNKPLKDVRIPKDSAMLKSRPILTEMICDDGIKKL